MNRKKMSGEVVHVRVHAAVALGSSPPPPARLSCADPVLPCTIDAAFLVLMQGQQFPRHRSAVFMLSLFAAGEGKDQHSSICSHLGWPPEVAKGLLEGVCSLAICCSHLFYARCISLPPSDAASELQFALVMAVPV